MANFDQLKQSVAALIRTNGAEEITGQIMQDVLLTIINSISGGYMFGGVAQHSGNVGNPDYNVFYLAGSGAYTGYGDAINIPNGCYGVFRYNGSWTQDVVDIGVHLTGTIREGETNGVTGDVINTALQQLFNNIMNILDTLTFTYNTPSGQQATKAMLDVIVTPTGGAPHVLTTLTLASATAAAAGLMSAEDKQKVDRMLTDFRSLSLTDTTAAADQATKIVQTLSATLGENPEAITTFTLLAATVSKAGLMSAADKAKLDALWSSGYQFAGIATPSTTPVSTTSKIFYIATEAGTYFNSLTVTQGINILSWNGSAWSTVQVIGIDDEPTAGSENLVKSGGVFGELALGAVYDVSAKNPTAGPNSNGKWESLSALLSDANLNTLIPTSVRKGGMSIKYVQSSDNKYVQYRLMSDDFTNDTTQWYSVDIKPFDTELNGKQNYTEGGYIKSDGFTIESNPSYGYSDYIDISSEVGNTIRVWTSNVPSDAYIFIYDENGGVDYYAVAGEYRAFTVPDGYVKMRFSFNNSYDTEVDRNNGAIVLWKKQRINGFITNTQNELEIPGRDIVRKDLVKQSSPQVISDIIKDFGNKIAIRLLNNDSILSNSAKIKANLYSGGSAFTGLDLTDEWTYWDSDKYIDKLYFQTTGEVTSAGSVIIEIAYGDYYNMVFWKNKFNLGSISLAGLDATKTIMFDTPINFIELSKIKVKVSNLVTSSAHPFVYFYGIYSSDGNIMERLVPITENTKENSVYSSGYDTLYGLYFWNHRSDAVSFDVEVFMEDVDNATQQLVSFDDLPMLPSYYKNYINRRQAQIRALLKSSIINGDAFYFITDSHWEYNAKNSPSVIKELNKQLNIPRLFHGGDMYHDGLRDDKFNVRMISLLKDALKTDKVYVTDGNHEFIHELATYGDVFAETRIFLDDVVFGGTNKNYYYVDNKQKKIRYINLYSFGEYVDGNITMGLTDTDQQAWFRDVAMNVESGWGIFIFSHTICDYNMINNSVFDYPGATAIYDIIDNYQGNGTILAFIIGHLHADCVVQNRCKCPIVMTTSDHNFPLEVVIGGDKYYDFSDLIESRESGTINEQAFDVVVYNKNNMTLNFVRIGSRAMNRSESFVGNAQVDIRTVLLGKLQVGNTLQVSSVLGINSWETSNNSVASVSNGIITANASGCAVITGTSTSNEKQSWFIKIV